MSMKIFECQCKFKFIIGNKKVWGPIFDDGNALAAHMMTLEEFEEQYGDCMTDFEKTKK